MPIRLSCACGKRFIAQDHQAGKRIKCTGCGQILNVPNETTAVTAAVPEKSRSSFDVFISHSINDKTTADAICATLEASGIGCWIAPRNILPGKEWGEAIIEAINSCRVMVLVLSAQSNQSPQVRREVERAATKGVT